jgi:4-hydroxy-tetrahydrodipicolinate synthase
MPTSFTGVISVVPTPFLPNGQIDFSGLKRIVDLFVRAGVNGLTASGVTSETTRLTESERMLIIETIIAHANGRVPIVVGTSTEGLHTCIELTKRGRSLGASAVMISPPRMPKLNSDAVVRHFAKVAETVDIPIVIQDYPPVSGFTMEASLLARIAREVDSAHTIKLEDPPTPFKCARVLEQTRGIEMSILGGLGGMYLLEELIAGAVGAMTGFAVPEILVRIMKLWNEGKRHEAADYFYRTVALMRYEFQEGIGMAIRKEMLRRRGVIAHSLVRAPGSSIDDSTTAALDSLIEWFRTQHPDLEWTLD